MHSIHFFVSKKLLKMLGTKKRKRKRPMVRSKKDLIHNKKMQKEWTDNICHKGNMKNAQTCCKILPIVLFDTLIDDDSKPYKVGASSSTIMFLLFSHCIWKLNYI
jgi:uncharacterized membrane-anchored protein YhcB (DUF1043 family)